MLKKKIAEPQKQRKELLDNPIMSIKKSKIIKPKESQLERIEEDEEEEREVPQNLSNMGTHASIRQIGTHSGVKNRAQNLKKSADGFNTMDPMDFSGSGSSSQSSKWIFYAKGG